MIKIFKDKFLLVLVLFTTLVFSNTLKNSYVWDDHIFIKNQNHSTFPPISIIIDGSYPVPNTGTYRPVRSFLYAITINTFNNSPSSHHLLVLSVHVFCTILVYALLSQISENILVSKVGAILFAIHPIHTENIYWITAGYDMFFVVFYLLTITSHIYARKNDSMYWLSYIFAALAFFTNEIALTLPLVIMAIDHYLFKLPLKDKKQLNIYIKYIIITSIYWVIRTKYIVSSPYETVVFHNLFGRFILGLILFGTYISQLFLPLFLNVDHYFQSGLTGIYSRNHNPTHPPPEILFQNPNIFIPLVLSFIWIIATYISMRKKLKISLPLLWVSISLIPVLRVVPLPIIYAERYAYLASVGFVLLLVTAFSKIKNKYLLKLVAIFLIGVIVSYSYISYKRSKDWQNGYTLWSHTLISNPESAAANSGLGTHYYVEGDYENSFLYHRKSALANPYYKHFQINYVAGLVRLNKYNEIIEFIESAVKVDSDSISLYTLLASTYDEIGDYKNAMKNYQRAYNLSTPGSSIQKEIEDLVDILDNKYKIVDLKQ